MRKTSSTAQPRQGHGLTATSMRTTALASRWSAGGERDYPPPGPGPFTRKGPEGGGGGGRALWWHPEPIPGPSRAPRGRLGEPGTRQKARGAGTNKPKMPLALEGNRIRKCRKCRRITGGFFFRPFLTKFVFISCL
jgi:hypothetical protein